MRVQIAQPVASAQRLQGFFQSTLPRYEHFSRGGSAVVGAGLMVGVVVKPDGPNAVSLGWEILRSRLPRRGRPSLRWGTPAASSAVRTRVPLGLPTPGSFVRIHARISWVPMQSGG